MKHAATIALGSILIAAISGGCDDRDSVRVYQAPKESAMPASIGAAGMPGDATAASPVAPAINGPQWVVPAQWASLPPQQMCYATFGVDPNDAKLQVVVSTFGSEMSALLPNVNMWETEVGATPSTAGDLPKVVTHLQSNGLEIDCVDIKGPPAPGQTEGSRLLAASIPVNGQMWFWKFAGPESKVTAHKAEFDAFLKSVSFAKPAVPQPAPVMTANPSDSVPTAASIPAFKAYTLPAGWALDPRPQPMRLATLHVSAGGQTADIIITTFATGHFGSAEANMNRWLGEAGLDPVTDASVVPRKAITVDGGTGFLLDLTSPPGTDPASAKQVVVAQIEKGGSTFFFKLIGPAGLVEQQKSAFNSFLQSVQFATDLP